RTAHSGRHARDGNTRRDRSGHRGLTRSGLCAFQTLAGFPRNSQGLSLFLCHSIILSVDESRACETPASVHVVPGFANRTLASDASLSARLPESIPFRTALPAHRWGLVVQAPEVAIGWALRRVSIRDAGLRTRRCPGCAETGSRRGYCSSR